MWEDLEDKTVRFSTVFNIFIKNDKPLFFGSGQTENRSVSKQFVEIVLNVSLRKIYKRRHGLINISRLLTIVLI